MSRFDREEPDLSAFRKNLIRFRENIRRSLGLPRRPGLLLRQRLIERRLQTPMRAVRRIRYGPKGEVIEEHYELPEEPPKRERPESSTPLPSLTSRSSQPPIRALTPAPEAGEAPQPSERRSLADAIAQWRQWRAQNSILGLVRRAFKTAVEQTEREMQLEVEKKEKELELLRKRLEEEEKRRRRWESRGIHY